MRELGLQVSAGFTTNMAVSLTEVTRFLWFYHLNMILMREQTLWAIYFVRLASDAVKILLKTVTNSH